MQEKAVTVAGRTYHLDEPFFVLATQNPIEQEGTYPLPEAQLDRFMFNIWLDYPSLEEEIKIMKMTTTDTSGKPEIVLTSAEILFFQNLIRKIPVPENVYNYAVGLASKTRPTALSADGWAKEYLTWGAGPRASQYLIIGAKCHSVLRGKYSPDIEDVRAVAVPVLRHRIVRNYKAEAEGIREEAIINHLL
jgi:MoxR-like ATPase